MGKCSQCVYHNEIEQKQVFDEKWKREFKSRFPSLPYEMALSHLCNCPQYVKTDFVTGESVMANCYDKNSYGECLFYEYDESLDEAENTDDENTDLPVVDDIEEPDDLPEDSDENDETETVVEDDQE